MNIIKKLYLCKTLNEIEYQSSISRRIDNLFKFHSFKQSYVSLVHGIIYDFNKNCVSKKIHDVRNGIPWWNPDIDKEIKYRNKLWKLNHAKPSILNHRNYKLQRNKVRNIIKIAKNNFWRSQNKNKNINQIYKMFRTVKNNKSKNICNDISEEIINNPEIIKKFAENLKGEIVNKDSYVLEETLISKYYKKICEKTKSFLCRDIENHELEKVISNLKQRKSPGIDGITNFMIKKGGNPMIKYLEIVYNAVMNNLGFPPEWNYAKTIPIPKGKNNIADFRKEMRPISLLSTISKIFERIILNRINEMEEIEEITSSKQFGFKKNCSTVDNLCILQSKIHSARTSKKHLIAVLLDIKSAYDTVNRSKLLYILKYIFGENNLLKFFSSFLGKRYFKIVMGKFCSEKHESLRGLPQGSCLSPLLFNIYTKMVTDENCVYGYADDLLLLIEGPPDTIVEKTNNVLNKISQKLSNLDLNLSPNKCKFMYVSRKYMRETIDIRINNTSIDRVQFCNYLGVIFDDKNTFQEHFRYMIKNVRKKMGGVKYLTNAIIGCKSETIINIYKSYIRSKMEYASIIWQNCSKDKLKQLNSIQHRFACWALGITFRTAVADVMKDTGLRSLEERRDIHSIKFIKRINTDELFNICSPVSIKKDRRKSNIFGMIKSILGKYNLSYTDISLKETKEIIRIIKKINDRRLYNTDKRRGNEFKLTKLIISKLPSRKTKRIHLEDEKNKMSRKKECLYNKIKFGVLNLNKFKSRINKNVNKKCPNLGCNGEESRTHFLFYCPKYENIRKNFFNNKRVKNYKKQEEILTDLKYKRKIIKYTESALEIREQN